MVEIKTIFGPVMPAAVQCPTVPIETRSDLGMPSVAAQAIVSIAPVNDCVSHIVNQLSATSTDVNSNFTALQIEVDELKRLCELQEFTILGLISPRQYLNLKSMLKSNDDDTVQLAYKMINEFRSQTTV
jgi:hypothetical protein